MFIRSREVFMKLNALYHLFFFTFFYSPFCCSGTQENSDELRRYVLEKAAPPCIYQRALEKRNRRLQLRQIAVQTRQAALKLCEQSINKKVPIIIAHQYKNLFLLDEEEQQLILEQGITLAMHNTCIPKTEELLFSKLKDFSSDTIKLRAWIMALKKEPQPLTLAIRRCNGKPSRPHNQPYACFFASYLSDNETSQTTSKILSPYFNLPRWNIEDDIDVLKNHRYTRKPRDYDYTIDTAYDADSQPPAYEEVVHRYPSLLYETDVEVPPQPQAQSSQSREIIRYESLLHQTAMTNLLHTPEIDLDCITDEDDAFIPELPEK